MTRDPHEVRDESESSERALPSEASLSEALLSEDRAAGASGEAKEQFAFLLRTEAQREARVRKLALRSWAVALTCLMAFALSSFLIRNHGGLLVEVVRAALLVFTGVGLVSLCAGVLASLRWLYQPRTASLKAIERRLASLESLIARPPG